jgi:hypothetical protein
LKDFDPTLDDLDALLREGTRECPHCAERYSKGQIDRHVGSQRCHVQRIRRTWPRAGWARSGNATHSLRRFGIRVEEVVNDVRCVGNYPPVFLKVPIAPAWAVPGPRGYTVHGASVAHLQLLERRLAQGAVAPPWPTAEYEAAVAALERFLAVKTLGRIPS